MTRELSAADEAALVDACRRDEPAAFERLYALHKDRVYSHALYVCGRPELAQDVTQQAFVRAHRALGRFRGEARLSTWLHRIVANLCSDALRKESRSRTVPLEDAAPAEMIAPERSDGAVVAHDRARTLERALATLPDETRATLVLRYLAGLSYDEIAVSQGVAKGTVASRIHRGLDALRETMEGGDACD